MKRIPAIPVLLLLCACGDVRETAQFPSAPSAPTPVASGWNVVRNGSVLQFSYTSGASSPQSAALDTDSGFLRMNTGPASGWGTSVMLLPCFWSEGQYYQGAPMTATWRTDGADLLISFSATVSTLAVQGEVRLQSPGQHEQSATVTVTVGGSVAIDPRPGEAFKPVMLSSMHVSGSLWDARAAFTDAQSFQIPDEGWIIQPAWRSTFFGLTGGSSSWKTNAPTIDVLMDQEVQVTGWVTRSSNPNDDNVGFWGAADDVLRRWQYRLRAVPP
jgi:hypothetical protein